MIYKKLKHPYGTRYMANGRLISEGKVPSHVLKVLENVPTFDDNIEKEKVVKVCIFCGVETKLSRFIRLQTIPICEEHYYSESTGRIVQQLRNQNAQETTP